MFSTMALDHERGRENYFTAGHSLFNFHISYEDFRKSLYYNLLLNPDGLAFVDHFFISEYFQKELLERGTYNSWIAQGLETGLIATHVKPGFSGFGDQLANQRSYGARGLPDQADRLAAELDRLGNARFVTLNRNYGETFDRRLKMLLIADSADFKGGFVGPEGTSLADFWDADLIKRLRIEGYERAKQLTVRSGTSGLRLATYIEAAREILTGTGAGVNDSVGALLGDLRKKPGTAKQADYVARFFKVMCDTFNVAMAECIGAEPNAPKLDHDFVSMQGIGDPATDELPLPEIIAENSKLPRLSVLNACPAHLLLECRAKGEPYFKALRTWQANQDDGSAGHVIEKLRIYTQDICKFYAGEVPADQIRIIIATENSRTRNRVARYALTFGIGIVSGVGVGALGLPAEKLVEAVAAEAAEQTSGDIGSILITNRIAHLIRSRLFESKTELRIGNLGGIAIRN